MSFRNLLSIAVAIAFAPTLSPEISAQTAPRSERITSPTGPAARNVDPNARYRRRPRPVFESCAALRASEIPQPRINIDYVEDRGGWFVDRYRITGTIEGVCLYEAGYYEHGQRVRPINVMPERRFDRFSFDLELRGNESPEIRVYTTAGEGEVFRVDTDERDWGRNEYERNRYAQAAFERRREELERPEFARPSSPALSERNGRAEIAPTQRRNPPSPTLPIERRGRSDGAQERPEASAQRVYRDPLIPADPNETSSNSSGSKSERDRREGDQWDVR